MKIAVASGKGGTGKTTVAVNLAYALANEGREVAYADCDVEEPNGHVFLKPDIASSRSSTILYPEIDMEACIACGKCAEICQYKAIIMIADEPMVFKDMCHGCAGCMYVCPVNAVREEYREIGTVETGTADSIAFIQGVLNVGQILSPSLIRDVKQSMPTGEVNILDCPPGTSCPVITAMRGADYILLVTEPTPFGFNDLRLTIDAVKELGIPYGVFINRSDIGTRETVDYCMRNSIPLLGEIPDDRRIASCYSNGDVVIELMPEYTPVFRKAYDMIAKIIS